MRQLFYWLLVGGCILASCSEEQFNDTAPSHKCPVTVYVENVRRQLRGITADNDNRLQASFSQNDRATAFWIDNDCSSTTLTYSESQGCFNGYSVSSTSDEIVLLYPEQRSYSLSDGRLTLPMPHQDGTIETLASTAYQWGFAKLEETENGFAGTTVMNPLLAICQFDFLHNGVQINHVVDLHIEVSKGGFYIDRSLNLSSGSWEEGNVVSSLSVHNLQSVTGSFYLGFFPTTVEMHIVVTDAQGNRYEGTVEQQKYLGGRLYPLSVACELATPAGQDDEDDFVEVCGSLWAKGNVVYDATMFGDNGYMEHYGIAENQWYYPETDFQDAYHLSHFNWGVCGDNATSILLCAKYTGDINSHLFTDVACNQPTDNDASAQYGDLAYWASKGRLRMPSKEEMYKLYSEASYCRGYYVTPEGKKVYGYLFWTPENGRTTSTKVRAFTAQELSSKLFLPDAGYRQSKSDERLQMNSRGYYWHSERDGSMNQLMLTSSGLVWRGTGAQYGRSIRPVKNEAFLPSYTSKPYIELLGMKWAKGNLQYGSTYGTGEGFRTGWSLSDSQWRFLDAGVGVGSHSSIQDPTAVYHFNWGVCGENALSQSLAATCEGDISGKMFLNQDCTRQTEDFNQALYGDIAYWASNGKYRLPTETEMYRLFTEASYSRGCYVDANGNKTFGWLFKDPVDGQRETVTQMQTYTDTDLERYLFLPCAGNRQAKSSDVLAIGSKGYYWHSYNASFNQITLGPSELIWKTTNAKYGRTVRPMFNE